MDLSIKLSVLTIGFALAVGCRTGDTENAKDNSAPVTLDTALKLGPGKLGNVVGYRESDVGQDFAAQLYATAKRIETEHALARRDLELVLQLDVWRKALADCRVGSFHLASIYFGGGTMHGNFAARDCEWLEDFLADLAKGLPLAEGKGSAEAAKQIDDAIAYIKNLNLAHGQNMEPEEWAKTLFSAEVVEVTGYWDHLKKLIKDVPEDEANYISTFAVGTLDWLDEME